MTVNKKKEIDIMNEGITKNLNVKIEGHINMWKVITNG